MNITPSAVWARYLLAASGSATLAASSASAAVIYYDPIDQTAAVSESFSFDIMEGTITPEGEATATAFRIENRETDRVSLLGTTSQPADFVFGTGGYRIAKLTANTSISGVNDSQAGNDFADSTNPDFDFENDVNYPWEAGSSISAGFVGLRFKISGQTHYAWAQFIYNDGADTITLVDFAYESTAGTPILAGNTGAIPEPGSAALITALAAGSIATYRRRRA